MVPGRTCLSSEHELPSATSLSSEKHGIQSKKMRHGGTGEQPSIQPANELRFTLSFC